MSSIVDFIETNNIGKYLENVDLSKYTTYKVGGIARLMVYPKDEKKLILLLRELKSTNIKYKVLGKGSNVLFSDKVFDGLVIKLDNFDNIQFFGNSVRAGSGVSLIYLSNLAIKKSLSGLEFATGIPGTVGGAVFMNAGAYKSDMGYVVKSVRVVTPNLEIITMTNKELNFHYRTSFLQQNPGYICLDATIQLKNGNKSEMLEIVKDRKERRLASQPLEYPSAGSVFRNPDNLFAGKLIEDLGYKGLVKGGAKVSEKHANFIINYNNATSNDIRDLILFIKDQVKEKYNVELKIEQEFVNWE